MTAGRIASVSLQYSNNNEHKEHESEKQTGAWLA
jgi:hypothetical protein